MCCVREEKRQADRGGSKSERVREKKTIAFFFCRARVADGQWFFEQRTASAIAKVKARQRDISNNNNNKNYNYNSTTATWETERTATRTSAVNRAMFVNFIDRRMIYCNYKSISVCFASEPAKWVTWLSHTSPQNRRTVHGAVWKKQRALSLTKNNAWLALCL